MERKVVTMGVTEFKRHCSKVLNEVVHRDGSVVILTKRGRPIRKVIPVNPDGSARYPEDLK
jgi:prevent-host-death family protein